MRSEIAVPFKGIRLPRILVGDESEAFTRCDRASVVAIAEGARDRRRRERLRG
jgi:hypothetical protein